MPIYSSGLLRMSIQSPGLSVATALREILSSLLLMATALSCVFLRLQGLGFRVQTLRRSGGWRQVGHLFDPTRGVIKVSRQSSQKGCSSLQICNGSRIQVSGFRVYEQERQRRRFSAGEEMFISGSGRDCAGVTKKYECKKTPKWFQTPC